MNRPTIALLFAAVLAVAVLPVASAPAQAADVNVTLIASGTEWHVGTATAAPDPAIRVAPGDTLRLTIRNDDGFDHTFTSGHFAVNDQLPAGATIFRNITTSSADLGSWEFYCAVPGHATGNPESRTGMVGRISVASPAGVDLVLIGGIVILVAIVVAAAALIMRRRKKTP